jgi:hypothetical protein
MGNGVGEGEREWWEFMLKGVGEGERER